ATLGSTPLQGDIDGTMFLAQLDAAGAVQWAKTFDTVASSMALDPAGNLLLSGAYDKPVDFGGGPLVPFAPFQNDVYVAKLDSSGGHIWSKGFPTDGNQYSNGIASDPAGNVFVCGAFDSAGADFGTGPLSSHGADDAFVLELSPTGDSM